MNNSNSNSIGNNSSNSNNTHINSYRDRIVLAVVAASNRGVVCI